MTESPVQNVQDGPSPQGLGFYHVDLQDHKMIIPIVCAQPQL